MQSAINVWNLTFMAAIYCLSKSVITFLAFLLLFLLFLLLLLLFFLLFLFPHLFIVGVFVTPSEFRLIVIVFVVWWVTIVWVRISARPLCRHVLHLLVKMIVRVHHGRILLTVIRLRILRKRRWHISITAIGRKRIRILIYLRHVKRLRLIICQFWTFENLALGGHS